MKTFEQKPNKKTIKNWFRGLDSSELSYLFPDLYSEIMESADPDRCDINAFIREAKTEWNSLSDEAKTKLYKQHTENK